MPQVASQEKNKMDLSFMLKENGKGWKINLFKNTQQMAILCCSSCKNVLCDPNDDQFEKECDKLLMSSIVRETARKQISFKRLTIKLNHRIKGLAVNIMKLYPNLEFLHFKGSTNFIFDESLEWKSCFGNLRQIQFESQISMKNVSNLFDEIVKNKDKFNKLEGLKLPQVQCVGVDTIKLKEFIDKIGIFLQNKPINLISLTVHISQTKSSLRSRHYKLDEKYLMERYWMPYNKFLMNILKMIENDNIFDGYLDFKILALPRRKDIEWNEQNENESLKIARIITKIEMKINLQTHEPKKKLILKLNDLQLTEQDIDFLKFWFKNDDYFFQATKSWIQFISM